MANVNIKFNNKEFLLSCEDGQEEHLEELSSHLDEKFNKLLLVILLIFMILCIYPVKPKE